MLARSLGMQDASWHAHEEYRQRSAEMTKARDALEDAIAKVFKPMRGFLGFIFFHADDQDLTRECERIRDRAGFLWSDARLLMDNEPKSFSDQCSREGLHCFYGLLADVAEFLASVMKDFLQLLFSNETLMHNIGDNQCILDALGCDVSIGGMQAAVDACSANIASAGTRYYAPIREYPFGRVPMELDLWAEDSGPELS